MTSLMEALGGRVVGTVEEVSADRIVMLLDPDAPHSTALNTGVPGGFPRINGYVLIPNESGATVCVVSSIRIERLQYPKRRGTQRDFGLVDLPFPSRLVTLTPLGTLKGRSHEGVLELKVQRGVDVFPSVGDPIHLPDSNQLRAMVEGEDHATAGRILLGHAPTAGGAPVHVDPDKLFGRHLAVLGNTGAGKSCTVAGLVRWSITGASEKRAENEREGGPNARFIILDPNGEYASAFKDLGVRLFQVDPQRDSGSPLKVPAWLWNGEEWAAFTDAAPGVQRPILLDALRSLRSGIERPDDFETRVRGKVKRYLGRIRLIIARGDHQGFGKRDDLAAVLLNTAEDFESLVPESEDHHHEELREKLDAVAEISRAVEEGARSYVDKHGTQRHNDFSETELEKITAALHQVATAVGLSDDGDLSDEDTPRPFSLHDLPDFVDALAAGQSGRDVAQFVDTLTLRIRGLLRRGQLASILHPDEGEPITLEDWLDDYIGADGASNGPIAVVDLSLVPSEVIYVVMSVLARMVFEGVQRYRRERECELPTTLVLEEAHTFVHRDLRTESAPPSGRACARVFERIAREGRKFGLGLVLASQRPSEISPTVLSQCNTFLLHRIVNDRDQELVRKLVPDGLGTLLRDLPSLPTRRAILLGWAAPAPVLVEVQGLPDSQQPNSPDPAFWDVWTGEEERGINWEKIATDWQGGDVVGRSSEAVEPGGVGGGDTDDEDSNADGDDDGWMDDDDLPF